MEDQEIEDQVSNDAVPTEADSASKGDYFHLIFAYFRAWVGRQSLPRTLGLLVGNTRDLELRLKEKEEYSQILLKEKDARIEYLETQVAKLQDHSIALQDSYLIGKGMLPTQPEAKATQQNYSPKTTSTVLPGEKYAIESMLDELKEIFVLRPQEAQERYDDLLATGRPRDKEIARRFALWLDAFPDPVSVVIQQ